MGPYNHLRSSSPSNNLRSHHSDDHDVELQDQRDIEKSSQGNVTDEQKERLLSGADDDEEFHNVALNEPQTRRRKWWHVGLFGLAGVVILLILGVLIYNLYLWEAGQEASTTFRRPSSDYEIDAGWDYNATSTVRTFDWEITDITANPDGVFRPMMVINGQFPGPMIVCNEGDTIVVNVTNHAKNATSIHWHGLLQNGTNFMDGTVGVTQCPIAPGQSFQYEFQVKGQAGSCTYCNLESHICHLSDLLQTSTTGTRLLKVLMALSAPSSFSQRKRRQVSRFDMTQIV